MIPTPTPLDVIWMRDQLAKELAATVDDPRSFVPLRRQFVECLLGALMTLPDNQVEIKKLDADTLRPAILQELRRLSPTGVACSKARWDQQRRRELPGAQRICRMFNVAWTALAAEAGLTPNPTGRRMEEYNPALDEPAEHQPLPDLDETGLSALHRRVEIIERGNVRTTTEIYTLR